MTMTIRAAVAGDATAMTDLFRRSVRILCVGDYAPDLVDAWTGGDKILFEPAIAKGQAHVAVAPDGDSMGFLDVVPGEILNLFVSPDHAGKGVGGHLGRLGLVLARIDHEGPIKVDSTLTAVPFYRSLGFRETGPRNFTPAGGSVKIPVMNMIAD